MKKKFFLSLNLILLAVLLVCVYIYDNINGRLIMKGTTAGCFVMLGLLNLVYALCTKPRNWAFPALLAVGLMLAMAGDLSISRNFILGAGLFAAGHVLYAAAMYARQKFAPLDALFSGVMFLIALAILTFTPGLSFSNPIFRYVCYAYAVIISVMAGKAVSGFLRARTLTNALLALGSVMFYFSDVMLLLAWFAGAGDWADIACIYTYFPGQGILAHAAYHHVREIAE